MIDAFFMGAIVMGFATAGLFFLRYWKETRERLFCLFAIAFFLLAANRVVLLLFHETSEHALVPYLVRLLTFGIILAAIIDKNIRNE